MNIRIKIFIALFFTTFVLSGCGKTQIESGNYSADPVVTSVGRFDTVMVDVPYFDNGFKCVDAYCSDSGYCYILNDYYTYINPNKFYYLVIDMDGKEIISEALSLPIYSDGNILRISSEYYLDELSDHHLSIENGYIYYNNMRFDNDGNISSVCCVGANYDEPGISGGIYREFIVSWNSFGKCISIKESENNEYNYSEDKVLLDFDPYNEYKASLSGIINVDNNGYYVSDYFDFINSDIRSDGFDIAIIRDDDHFSGIFSDVNGYTHLGCFIRNDSKRNVKPLVLACSGVNDLILDYVYAFNNNNSDFRIVIEDYSEKTISGTPSEGWSLLKEDIDTGFRPDMIFNTIGYDSIFIDTLNSKSILCDLTDIIHEDSETSATTFTYKASELFYGSEKIYSIIPSFSYYSVVGNINVFGKYKNWGYSDYVDFTSELGGEYTVFYMDTCTSFIKRVLEYNGNEYVNFETGFSEFDSDEFVSLLKYASSLPYDYDEALNLMYSDVNLGNYLLNDVQCHNIGDMNYYSTLYCMGDYMDVGFPHGGSGEGSGVISADLSIMIMSSNAYANECWDFCKQFLSSEYQENIFTGIPVTESGYDSWKSKTYIYSCAPDRLTYVKNGVEYTVPPVDDMIANDITSRIESCEKIRFSDYNIEKIVFDYSSKCFDGEITAEEAASLIDRDVEAYLAS